MDLISRQDAIDELDKGAWKVEWDKALAKAMLENLPSAEPKPITVNIDHELTPYEYEKLRKDMANAPIILLPSTQKKGKNISKDGFLCSLCGFGDFGGFHGYEPNYCPNCGARMVRGDKDE